MKLRALTILVLLASLPLTAQELDPNNKRGFEPGSVYHFSGLDSVSVFSGNLNLAIPIGQTYTVRPGFSYQFMLSYNSKLWDFEREIMSGSDLRASYPEKYSNAGLGWLLSLGRVLAPPITTSGYVYVSPDGAHHDFAAVLGGRGGTGEAGVFYSTDSTYIRLKHTPASAQPGQATRIQIETRDGLIHTFSGAGNLTKIADRYGNWVKVVPNGLTVTFNEGRGENPETIARTHTVTFENAPPNRYAHPNFATRVKTVSLAAFSGATADFTFTYDDTMRIDAGSCVSNSSPTGQHNVPLLKKVELPDASTFEMMYDPMASICSSGTIQKLTLPTKGAIKWAYAEYPMSRANCIDDPNYAGEYWYDSYAGVTKRTLVNHNDTVLEETTYLPELLDEGNDVYNCGKPVSQNPSRPLPPKVLKNVVKSRSGAKTEHYFSAFRAQGSYFTVPDAFRDEYGLPFTRTEVLETLPLSTKTYSSSSALLRTAYTEYEDDGTGTKIINQRQRLVRTVFNDDDGDPACKDDNVVAPCWIQQESSDFDGFGHYRQQTTTSNYVGATDRTTFTNFNPGLTPTSPWASGSPWLVDTHTGTSITEGNATISSVAKFDAATGVLSSTQTGTGTGAMLAATCRDANGLITSQRWFGGDEIPTTPPSTPRALPVDPCTATRREGEMILTHTYDNAAGPLVGHTAAWEWTSPNPATNKVIDETIDGNTGLPSSARDGAGLTTTYDFDPSSRITSITPPGLAETTFTYSNASVTQNVLTPASVEARTTSSDVNLGAIVKQYQYDAAGRLWREKTLMPDDSWSVRETKYNTDGYKLSVSELEKLVVPQNGTEFGFAPSNLTRFTGYDAFGRVGLITAPDGRITSFTYRGSRVTTREVAVATTFDSTERLSTTERSDAHGRLASITEGDTTTSYGYHVSGKLASVAMTAAGVTQERAFTYDSRGLMTGETHPELGASGNGSVTYSLFDARGQARRKQTGTATAFDLRMTYDDAGRLTQIANASGQNLKEFQFDPADGRLTATGRHNVVPHLGTIAVYEGWGYDASTGLPGRRDVTIDSSAAFTDGRTFAHVQFYNDLGSVRQVGYPFRTANQEDPDRNVLYSYKNGLLTGVTDWAAISYQPNGAIGSVTHNGSVTETWTADPDGMARPRKIEVKKGQTTYWTSGDYAFDGAGNIADIGATGYVYDALGRLTKSREGEPTAAHNLETLDYDAFGNRRSLSLRGCTAPSNCYTTAIVPRKITGTTNHYADATYDAAGNVLTDGGRTFTYDALGATTSVVAKGRTFIYLYTADDERVVAVERLANGTNVNTWTLRGFGNELLSVFKGNTWNEDQIWRGSSVVGYLTSVGKRHYSLDHLGSPRVITDDSGNLVGTQKFRPFGSGGSTGSGSLQFTAHERDRANLAGGTMNLPDYAHARMLDTDAGRFLSTDPMPGRQRDPQSWNRYTYALNNPLKYTDPDGRYVTNCSAGDKQCNADAAAFEAARQNNLKSKDAAVAAAANAYGNPGDANGITVTFGATGQAGATTTAQLQGNADGTMGMTASVTIKSGLRGTELSAAIAHEGQHVLDAQGFVSTFTTNAASWDISKNLTSLQTEMNAYRLTHSVFAAARQTFSTGCNGCTLGGAKPLTPADRDLAIRKILADPGGTYKVTPQNQGTRQFPEWTTPP